MTNNIIEIQKKLSLIRQNIALAEKKYYRTPGAVTLVAVTKAQSTEKITAAINAKQLHFAENYLQEALPKIKACHKITKRL